MTTTSTRPPSSRIQSGQPAQGSQARREEILAASRHDEPWQTLQPPTDRLLRDGELTGPVVRARYRVLVAGSSEEEAVLHPLRLDELECIAEIPVMVAAGWSEAQKRAYVLADNQLAITGSGWDPELLRLELGELK